MSMVEFMSIKAQTLTYDFFIATSLLLLLLIATFFLFYYKIENIEEEKRKSEMVNVLISASDIWFKEGYPEYWNVDNVIEIGLANNNRINTTKVRLMEEMGYQKLASLLSLGTFNVNYFVYLQNGSLIYSFPNSSFENAKDALVLERIAIWNDSIVKVRTLVWQKA
jgi:hypothetical protein